MSLLDILNTTNKLNQNNPFQQNGVSAGLIPGTVQYQQANPQKTTLQQAYEQAMSKTTPSWVSAISNAIPSIAQIGALGATKGAFNQGYVADSLERQKQRQMAYNQAKQQQEQQQVKDFVAMAKDQMGIDRADENRDYTRAYQEAIDKQNQANRQQEWENKLALQDEAKEQREFENEVTTQKLEMQKKELNARLADIADKNSPEAKNLQAEKERIALQLQEQALIKAKRENDPEVIAKKEEKEQYEKDLSEVNKLIEKKLVNASDGAFLLRHPEAYKEIIQRYPFSPFRGKFEIPSEIIKKYENIDTNNDPLGVR